MRVGWLDHRYRENIGDAGSRAGAHWLAGQISQLLPQEADRSRVGCYVATFDAGADVSVTFWRAAMAQGVDLVNPRDFPWTLASTLAADAACQAGIMGPCYTLVGAGEAMIAALATAVQELSAGLVEVALVAGIDPCGGRGLDGPAAAAMVALSLGKGKAVLEQCEFDSDGQVPARAADLLVQACQALDDGRGVKIGARWEGGFLIHPAS